MGLVGSHENVAERLAEYRDAGFSTFILAGNPHGRSPAHRPEVLPLVQTRRHSQDDHPTALKASA